MSNLDLNLLDAQIAEGQESLRVLHAQKRSLSAANRRAEIEKSSGQAKDQGLQLAAVSQPGTSSQTSAGFPTAKSRVDMTRSQQSFVNTALTDVDLPQAPPVEQMPERDVRFLQGSISVSRGPQFVSLFARTKS